MDAKQQAAMKAKLAQLGLAFEDIKVFGAIRCNVHIVCVGRETALKWAHALAHIFKVKPFLGEHLWDAKENRNTSMCPTKRSGFLVSVAA